MNQALHQNQHHVVSEKTLELTFLNSIATDLIASFIAKVHIPFGLGSKSEMIGKAHWFLRPNVL